jgi:hypothetical protein
MKFPNAGIFSTIEAAICGRPEADSAGHGLSPFLEVDAATKKAPQLREKSWGQVQQLDGSKRWTGTAYGGAMHSRSTPQPAPPKRRLAAPRFYSAFFLDSPHSRRCLVTLPQPIEKQGHIDARLVDLTERYAPE